MAAQVGAARTGGGWYGGGVWRVCVVEGGWVVVRGGACACVCVWRGQTAAATKAVGCPKRSRPTNDDAMKCHAMLCKTASKCRSAANTGAARASNSKNKHTPPPPPLLPPPAPPAPANKGEGLDRTGRRGRRTDIFPGLFGPFDWLFGWLVFVFLVRPASRGVLGSVRRRAIPIPIPIPGVCRGRRLRARPFPRRRHLPAFAPAVQGRIGCSPRPRQARSIMVAAPSKGRLRLAKGRARARAGGRARGVRHGNRSEDSRVPASAPPTGSQATPLHCGHCSAPPTRSEVAPLTRLDVVVIRGERVRGV